MTRNLTLATLLAIAISGWACAQAQPSSPLRATVDAASRRPPISPYLYGQFIEHIGDLVNRSMWAEMIDDRKFFHPIHSREDLPAPVRTGPPRGRQPNRWKPIGPDASVLMDRQNPYTGEHSPRIFLAGAESRGIRQAGIALQSNRPYSGRIVLQGDPTARVTVSLVWGPGASDRQQISIPELRSEWVKCPLQFTAGAHTTDATLEITGTGSGSFRIGAVSLMPSNNIKGFRPEVMSLLKQLRSGMYRFPGGNFLSAHEWRDAIGDPDKRPPIWDPVWSALQPNDVGTDEFLTMCELLEVDAFLSVNAGFGDAHSAAQLVEYVNGAPDTPMGRLRAANGHPEPYRVKWWGIGNEMYGTWQFGYMAPLQYVVKHNLFAKAMRAVDPSIILLGTGATPEEMTVNRLSLALSGKIVPDFGSDADFTGLLLTHCFQNIDIMSEHFYSYHGERFDLAQNKRVPYDEPLPESVYRAANRMRQKVEAYEEYERRFPAIREKKLRMALDEWAFTRLPPNLKQTLANGLVFHEMFRSTKWLAMAGHTMATSSIEYNATQARLNATGLLFQLYRDHFGAVPVEVSGNAPPPAPKFPVGGDQPRINAGSPTYPLDVCAALSEDGKRLTVAVINPMESAQTLDLQVRGVVLRAGAKRRRLTGPGLDAMTGISRNEVQVTEASIQGSPSASASLRLELTPLSIDIYTFDVQG